MIYTKIQNKLVKTRAIKIKSIKKWRNINGKNSDKNNNNNSKTYNTVLIMIMRIKIANHIKVTQVKVIYVCLKGGNV